MSNKKYGWLNSLTERMELKLIKENPCNIQFIVNPTIEAQLKAIEGSGYNIEFIENPPLEVQLAAVRNHGDSIQYIKNPSLEVKMESLKEYKYSLNYLEDEEILNIDKNILEILIFKNHFFPSTLENIYEKGCKVVRDMIDKYNEMKDYNKGECVSYE